MPLLDHFNPPLNIRRQWQGFHSAWANTIVRQLNQGLLPPSYYAEPNVKVDGQVEIDVGTLQERSSSGPEGGLATLIWTAPPPTLAAPVDFADLDSFEVQVINNEEGPRLVAAIELIGPANKDRPSHRRAFTIKCASYLQAGVSLVLIDVVTSRTGNLHLELLTTLDVPNDGSSLSGVELYAGAYRTAFWQGRGQLEAWTEPLHIGADLPTMPLWLGAECVLPLDTEESYTSTCETLRMG